MANVAGAELVLEKPILGHGAGMFDARFYNALAALSRDDDTRTIAAAIERFEEKGAGAAHNDYLQIWAEFGTLGLAGFLLLAICLLWPMAPPDAGGLSLERARWLIACQASLATALALAFVSFPLQTPERATLFWALAAHVLAGRERE
jgi:O-antigen ligase